MPAVNILCMIQLRNEARYLPGFLHHMAPHVDGIVALDDGSTDATPDILRAEPKVLSILRESAGGQAHANETSNRHRLLVEAARLGAQWVICVDADERFETSLLRRLPRETRKAEARGQSVLYVKIVNLWNHADQYRVDGLTAPRWTARLFRVPETITRRGTLLHQPWFPPELDQAPHGYVPALLYHLRMIERADREARYAKFMSVDPDLVHQPIGYEHLIDETGLTLKKIQPFHGYVDLPPGDAREIAPAPPAAADCRADAEFARRFHLVENRPLHRAVADAAADAIETSHLYGFDFDAIFAGLRARQA